MLFLLLLQLSMIILWYPQSHALAKNQACAEKNQICTDRAVRQLTSIFSNATTIANDDTDNDDDSFISDSSLNAVNSFLNSTGKRSDFCFGKSDLIQNTIKLFNLNQSKGHRVWLILFLSFLFFLFVFWSSTFRISKYKFYTWSILSHLYNFGVCWNSELYHNYGILSIWDLPEIRYAYRESTLFLYFFL